MTKAGVKAVFPKVYEYIKSREQTHRIVGLDEDPMDTMSAVSSSTPLNRWRSLCNMQRMVDYTDALLKMGTAARSMTSQQPPVRGLKGKEDFMPHRGHGKKRIHPDRCSSEEIPQQEDRENEKKVDAV